MGNIFELVKKMEFLTGQIRRKSELFLRERQVEAREAQGKTVA